MVKIFEALIIFLSGHLLTNPKSGNALTGVDLILSKSRIIAIFFVGAITLPLLFVGGLMLAFVGISHWVGENEASNVFRMYVLLGGGLAILSLIAGAFGLSKKRFEISPEKKPEVPPPVHAAQVIEQVVVNVIKEFIKDTKPSNTAAPHPPTYISNA